MKLTKIELEHAIKVLKENGEKRVASVLSDIVEDKEATGYDLINRDHYFATLLWQKQDIIDELNSRKIEPTEEMISDVLCNIDTCSMEDASSGWEFIYDAIDKTLDEMEEEKEQ